MEKNYNTNNFEQLLRDTTDEFRMYPSRRVWHSLYNDLHPGRKWPSLAILLLFITSIMYVGVTNSNDTSATAKKSAGVSNKINKNLIADGSQPTQPQQTGTSFTEKGNTVLAPNSSVLIASVNRNGSDNTPIAISLNSTTDKIMVSGKVENTDDRVIKEKLTSSKEINNTTENEITDLALTTERLTNISVTNGSAGSVTETNNIPSFQIPSAAAIRTALKAVVSEEKINTEDKAWMDEFLLRNKKSSRKWKNRILYQVYITPSVGYRSLKKNTDYTLPDPSALIANPVQVNTMEYMLSHSSAINLEAGTNLIFSFTKKVRFKAGVQLNYTNYRINAYQLDHPTFTTLMLNDMDNGYPVLAARTTSVANTPGRVSKNFNNNTYQVSLPLGADYKIAGSDKIKWYAGATVQPTYVTGGHSYLISSDLKNYVEGEDLMRKFNINGGIETFVSFKTKNGIILSAGPQFRYQFLSTYSQRYSYDEKLYNLGVKLGMTANF